MEENKILLSEVVQACVDFKQFPTEDNDKKLKNILSQLQIASYLSLSKKREAILYIVSNVLLDTDDNIYNAELRLLAGRVIYGIFPYVVNLENDISIVSIDTNIVDLLFELGVVDYILGYCQKDYDRLNIMIQETFNFSNLFRLLEGIEVFSNFDIKEFNKSIDNFKKDLDAEKLSLFKSILNESDPKWVAFKETVGDEVLERVRHLEELKEKQDEVKDKQ